MGPLHNNYRTEIEDNLAMSCKVNEYKALESNKSNFFCRLEFISCHWWKNHKSDVFCQHQILHGLQ